jgi:hypothetical protein
METDILGGVQLGFHTILVLSGGTRFEDLARYAYKPELIVKSVATLADFLETNTDRPLWQCPENCLADGEDGASTRSGSRQAGLRRIQSDRMFAQTGGRLHRIAARCECRGPLHGSASAGPHGIASARSHAGPDSSAPGPGAIGA